MANFRELKVEVKEDPMGVRTPKTRSRETVVRFRPAPRARTAVRKCLHGQYASSSVPVLHCRIRRVRAPRVRCSRRARTRSPNQQSTPPISHAKY